MNNYGIFLYLCVDPEVSWLATSGDIPLSENFSSPTPPLGHLFTPDIPHPADGRNPEHSLNSQIWSLFSACNSLCILHIRSHFYLIRLYFLVGMFRDVLWPYLAVFSTCYEYHYRHLIILWQIWRKMLRKRKPIDFQYVLA